MKLKKSWNQIRLLQALLVGQYVQLISIGLSISGLKVMVFLKGRLEK